MTRTLHTTEPSAEQRDDVAFVGALLASSVAGVLLGVLDLMAQLGLGHPWAKPANSPAVWGIAAFALGYTLRSNAVRAAACGAALLTIGVEAYYLAAVVALHDSTANLTSPTTGTWPALGIVAGAGCAVAGLATRLPHRVARAAGWVVLGALAAAAVTCLV